MSLLPTTLLNASSNEDQTLEIHTEILEPLSHSQVISRWEIPHKNILDSDSILAWECNWELMTGGTAEHTTDGTLRALPLAVAGLYNSIKRARLYVNGKIISELVKDGMDEEEALEFYDFNIVGAYMGEFTPIYIDDTGV